MKTEAEIRQEIKEQERGFELQDYLANREVDWTKEDLIQLRDDYVFMYRELIYSVVDSLSYHLSQLIFFQEELNSKLIIMHLELIEFLAKKASSIIHLFARNQEAYEFLKIQDIIDDNFKGNDCNKMVGGKYKNIYYDCKNLLDYNISYQETSKLMERICRTDKAKKWLHIGEFDNV